MDLENLEGLENEQRISMLRQKDALVKELEGRLKAQSMAEEDEQEELAEVSDEEKLAEDEEKKKMGEYRNLTERLTADNSQQAATINQLSEQVARLDAMSPLAVLQRGYAIASSADGRVLRDAADAHVGEVLELRLRRGRLTARALQARVAT